MSNFTSPAIQAMNLVRYIGDEVSESGMPIRYLNCADIHDTPVRTLPDNSLKT